MIGLDTYDRALGDHLLPDGLGEVPHGLEFVLVVDGGEARLLAAADYAPWVPRPIQGSAGDELYLRNPQLASRSVRRGDFRPLVLETNRRRLGRDGTVFPAQRLEWGRLRHGPLERGSLNDWHYDPVARICEFRLPWGC